MFGNEVIFRIHCVQRMFERGLDIVAVKAALLRGETIEDYPDDFPYPSRLVLDVSGARPLHVVAAYDQEGDDCYYGVCSRSVEVVERFEDAEVGMVCVICKHGTTSANPVTVTLDRAGSTLVVRGVPAEVCDNCGEQYVDSAVAEKLVKDVDRQVGAGVEVEVRKYVAA